MSLEVITSEAADLLGFHSLVFRGTVSTATSGTEFASLNLAGFGDDFFESANQSSWEIYVLRDAGGAGADPSGLYGLVSNYVSSTGTFTHVALSSGTLAVGDEILIVHPSIAALGTKADAAAAGAVTATDSMTAYIKQLVTFNRLLTEIADGTDVFPASVAQDSLFAKLLAKGDPAVGTSFDNTTDSLEAIRDAIDALGGLAATDKGVRQYLEVSVTAAANAGDTTLATAGSGNVIVKSVVVRADAAQTGNMTSIAVLGADSKVVTFISAVDGVQANFDATGKQVAFTGAVFLLSGETILMVHDGTGAAALNLTVTIEFEASSADGATLT